MALTDEGNIVMPVAPMGGNGGLGGGIFGGDLSILVLFFLFMMMGGWGNGFGGFGGGDLYPWMNNSQNINSGFRDQMLGSQINGIQSSITSGFGDVATALCGGFAGVNASINGAQNAITQQMYANTIADMERSFGVQTQLQNCCCENRAATADLKYTVATEACADRAAIASALRDVIDATQSQTQVILDKMCQQEIDALKSQNLALQNQVNMQALAASQTAQTAALVADNTAQTQYIVNRVAPYPIPAYTVANPVTPAA
jgi:hypothetical protein